MPSPFPGMDPYLENPAYFGDFHDSFIVYLKEHIQSNLPEGYVATIGTRVWLETSGRYLGPDVKVQQDSGNPKSGTVSTAAAVAVRTPPIVVQVAQERRRETFLEIRTLDDRRLVTTIEMLSPTNNGPGEAGRKAYRRKQKEILGSPVHLVEIDLLRGGRATTAIPLEVLRRSAHRFDHHVCVHRFDRPDEFQVYPIRLTDPLPEIAVPLLENEEQVAADLQQVFDRCWQAGAYRKMIRYGADPLDPPLAPDLADWVEDILARNRAAP